MTTSYDPCRVYTMAPTRARAFYTLDDTDDNYIEWFSSFEDAQSVAAERNEDHRRRLELQMWSV